MPPGGGRAVDDRLWPVAAIHRADLNVRSRNMHATGGSVTTNSGRRATAALPSLLNRGRGGKTLTPRNRCIQASTTATNVKVALSPPDDPGYLYPRSDAGG